MGERNELTKTTMNKPNSSLTQFIEEYPLYSKFGTDQPIEAADLNNLAFNFFCKHEKEVHPFRLQAIGHNNNGKHQLPGGTVDFTEMFAGVCQSCVTYTVNIIISGASQDEKPRYFIRKIGQYPAPEASMAKLTDEIAYFLNDESRELYEKALKNLEWEFGMGALTYFRRLIRNEVEKIIEALSNPYSSQGNKIAEALSSYKQLRQKTKFVEEITPFLPKSLQVHGANSLLMLYDAASMAIDELTETECIKKSKDIDTLFRYLVRKICLERNEAFGEKPPGKYFLRYR
jgi:hypothetical protein